MEQAAGAGFIEGWMQYVYVLARTCICVGICVHTCKAMYGEIGIRMIPRDTAVRFIKILSGIDLAYLQQDQFGCTHTYKPLGFQGFMKISFVTSL